MPESKMPKQTWYRRLIFLFIFVLTNVLAIYSLPLFISPATQSLKESSGNSIIFPIYYIAAIILFTLVFIYLARKQKISVLKILIGILLGYSLFVILLMDLSFLFLIPDFIITVMLTVTLIFFSFKRKRIAVYALGIILGAGIAAILASIITLEITVIIMAVFSIYDYLSVNIAKSMIEVAETAMDSGLPLLFSAGEGDETIAMGFGDTVLPTFALMAILVDVNFTAYAVSFAFAAASFIPMMYFASRKPQPGLPYMMNGIFLGLIFYFISLHFIF